MGMWFLINPRSEKRQSVLVKWATSMDLVIKMKTQSVFWIKALYTDIPKVFAHITQYNFKGGYFEQEGQMNQKVNIRNGFYRNGRRNMGYVRLNASYFTYFTIASLNSWIRPFKWTPELLISLTVSVTFIEPAIKLLAEI